MRCVKINIFLTNVSMRESEGERERERDEERERERERDEEREIDSNTQQHTTHTDRGGKTDHIVV